MGLVMLERQKGCGRKTPWFSPSPVAARRVTGSSAGPGGGTALHPAERSLWPRGPGVPEPGRWGCSAQEPLCNTAF